MEVKKKIHKNEKKGENEVRGDKSLRVKMHFSRGRVKSG